MRTLLNCLTSIAAIALVFLSWVPLADAHPLGNFTINHYAGLHIERDHVGIDYVLDMAEIPAFQEIRQLDLDRNHKADVIETKDYPADKCREVKSHLNLRLNQTPLALSLTRSNVEFPPGVGGLDTLRLTCGLEGAIASPITNQLLEFEDTYYSQRLGWREITVSADVPVQGNVFTSTSITKRLTDYPTDLLSSPLNQRQVSLTLNPSLLSDQSVAPLSKSANQPSQALIGRTNDAFTRLITLEDHSLSATLVALAIAFVWGGFHALSPGHGKTIVGAYLVGSRSKVHHALVLGLTVTLTHTIGIFALGLLMLGTSQFVLTEAVFPWLNVMSGVLVTGIGLNLLIQRSRSSQIFQTSISGQGHHHHHDHHDHDHDHLHDHSHDHGHSHLPPGADGSITWSSILALGISGGLLPCPSALVVLLSAIALGRIGFGLALVSAFSLGLAGVLTAIGLTLVYAKDWFERLPIQASRSRFFPAMSALFVTLIGLGITTKALLDRTL